MVYSKIKQIFICFKLGKTLFKFAKNPENNTPLFFVIVDCISELGIYEQGLLKIKENPYIATVIKERPPLLIPQLDELLKLNSNSLGHLYAAHLVKNNLKPEFYGQRIVHNEASYVFTRNAIVHDLVHIATDFDTTIPGEMGIQSLYIRQTLSPVAIIIISSFIFRSLFRAPVQTFEIMEAITKGWRVAKMAHPLFAIDWANELSTPINEFRKKYQIEIGEPI